MSDLNLIPVHHGVAITHHIAGMIRLQGKVVLAGVERVDRYTRLKNGDKQGVYTGAAGKLTEATTGSVQPFIAGVAEWAFSSSDSRPHSSENSMTGVDNNLTEIQAINARFLTRCQKIGLVGFMFFLELLCSYVSLAISLYVSLTNLSSIIHFLIC